MYGVVLHAHPVRGESHNQRNTTGEIATKALMNESVNKEWAISLYTALVVI